LTFWYGTNYQTLVHKVSRNQPNTMKELLNIATRHASSEEVVRAIFIRDSGKVALGGGRGVPVKMIGKGAKRSAKSDKRGLKW
jgi:hypothetical protein